MTPPPRNRFVDLVIAIVLLLVAVIATWTAYAYTRSSGLFPIFAGWLFIALVAIEVAVQLRNLRRPAAAEVASQAPEAKPEGLLSRLGGPAWLGFLLLAIWLAGFLVAIPVFLFLFLFMAAKRSAGRSAVVAIAMTLGVYLVFAWLLEYRLYAGLLFGA